MAPPFMALQQYKKKKIFLLVTECPGVGPKLGLGVVRQLAPGQFIQIIIEEDKKALSTINGIGPKRAEQIIVQLKHKVAALMEQGFDVGQEGSLSHWREISEDLMLSITQGRKFLLRLIILRNQKIMMHLLISCCVHHFRFYQNCVRIAFMNLVLFFCNLNYHTCCAFRLSAAWRCTISDL